MDAPAAAAATGPDCDSALEFCLLESLGAYPDTSHLRLFDFLQESGEDAQALDRFRQLWNRAFVSSRVFGQTQGVDVKKLSQHLVHENDVVVDSSLAGVSGRNKPGPKSSRMTGNVNSAAAQAHASLAEMSARESDLGRLDDVLRQVQDPPGAAGAGGGSSGAPPSSAMEILLMRKSLRVLLTTVYIDCVTLLD
jgi:hypothetical protein